MATSFNITGTEPNNTDFFQYWDSLGFFDNIQAILPPQFFVLFEIARLIFSEETSVDAFDAIKEITKEETIFEPNRDETIQVNRLERIAPVGDRIEIDTYKSIQDLRKALPRELAMEDAIFNMKLFTKTLLVMKFFETEADSFRPISTSRDQKGKDAMRFEQKFYILLDRSKSMENRMRTFYAKCIVAEFLRRKLNSNAKLFYRAFDSKPGELFKVEKREDFTRLIEEVLMTTTGGTSTNLDAAITQAIADIQYDKDMMKSEILVITDGISKIDKNQMKIKLGDIRLNVLKIGGEIPEPDFFEMEGFLKGERINFDPTRFNIREIKAKAMASGEEDKGKLSVEEQRIYRLIFDFSDKMFKDLREAAYKYVEIKDLETEGLFKVDDQTIAYIMMAVENLNGTPLDGLDLVGKQKLFKQVIFLSQYIQMLLENGNGQNAQLLSAAEQVTRLKMQLMKNPDILFTFMEVKQIREDREMMKLAKKEMRELMKKMQLDDRKLSIKEMRMAKVLFTMDMGKGSMGQFFLLLFVKMMEGIKRLFRKIGGKEPAKPLQAGK